MATTQRFGLLPNDDNTGRAVTYDYQAPAYASSIALAVNAYETTVQVGQLTGALTMTVGVGSSTTAPYVGDKLRIMFSNDANTRVVTFSTGFTPNGTLSNTASKLSTIDFVFDGTTWRETGRTTTA